MRKGLILLTLLGLALAQAGPGTRAQDISTEQVRKAIDQGVDYLKSQQRADGSWPDWVNQPNGVTALCTLAMLNSGVPVEDDNVRRALTSLSRLGPEKINATYAISLQTMVFCRADPKRYAAQIRDNVDWIEKVQIQTGRSKGSWAYPGEIGSTGDNSNSQFALLALYEADRVGQPVDPRVWRLAKAYWENCQNADGSWGYKVDVISGTGSGFGTGSMTCAGISSLVIASDMVLQSDAQATGDRIQCCQRSESEDDRLQRALQWLGKNFAVTRNPGERRQAWLLYYLYGLERVGRLTAQRFIGGHDWYREGTDHLLRMKGGVAVSAGWRGVGFEARDDRVATSLALLFLSKGRRPVLMAKLDHGGPDQWNQHRSDVANLTRYVESKWNRDLTWQAVDLQAATVDDLMQSPVLYYCGRNDPRPPNAEAEQALAERLRGYVNRGKFIFAEAYSTGRDFDQGFRQLMTRVFPEPEYRLQLLPPEHPIWRAEERVDPAQMRPVWGIEFGCRTSVVYFPPDDSGHLRPSLSCLWELSRQGRGEQFAPNVQAAVDAGLSTGINVLAYATNRELQYKDMIPASETERTPGDPFRRNRFRIANLRHPGGCNAAPRALTNLLDTAADQLKIRVEPEARLIALTDPTLFDHHLVFMHGRNAFRLTDGERRQLAAFIERGGILMANSICASRAFTASFRREMENIFPDHPMKPIPVDDPIFSPDYGGYDLSTVTRRDPQSSGDGPMRGLMRKVAPELEAVRFGDRYGVIFSRYDLSCALEKHDSLECQGYVREDAARIALNVVLYSLQH